MFTLQLILTPPICTRIKSCGWEGYFINMSVYVRFVQVSRNFANFRHTCEHCNGRCPRCDFIHACRYPYRACCKHVRLSVVCVLKACSASVLCICKVCQVISAWALTLFVPCVSGNAKASGRGTYNCETALFLLTDTT